MGLEKEVQGGMFKGKEMECRGDRRAGLGPCTDDAVKAKGFVLVQKVLCHFVLVYGTYVNVK